MAIFNSYVKLPEGIGLPGAQNPPAASELRIEMARLLRQPARYRA
jgi:hypothetical protein